MVAAAVKTEEAVDRYLAAIRSRGLSPRTIEWYRMILRRYAERQAEVEASAEEVERFLGEIAGTPETRHGYYRALRAFYGWASKRLDVHNPMVEIPPPRRKRKRPRSLTLEELGCLLLVPLDPRDRALVNLLVDTGIRVGEAVMLCREDIGAETMVVDGKTGQREVPISEETRELLLGLVESGRVFTGTKGPLTRSGAYRVVRMAMAAAGIDGAKVGPHTLRHTFGRQYILAGGDLVSLQRIMGHSDIGTTRIYAEMDLRDIVGQHGRFSPLRRAILAPQGRFLMWGEGEK